jgi:hypothetical protein
MTPIEVPPRTEIGPASASWHLLLRTAKAARRAAYLSARAAAEAAAAQLGSTDWKLCSKARAVLASQAAKGRFITDLREFDRLLEKHEAFLCEMKSRRPR